jgi:Family of unknown function (DUF6236)
MSRTILYYPNIEVPTSGLWIRRALLYWDDVAAIVPPSYDHEINERAVERFRPEVQELYERKIFRPLNPGSLFMDHRAASAFTTDWETVSADLTRKFTPLKRPDCNVPIYKDKASPNIFYDLKARGLAKETRNPALYLFESSTAVIYMALLAKHMAAAQPNPTIPGTDVERLSDLAFGKNTSGNMQPVLSARLADMIPVPSPSVSLKAVLDFRQRYQAELLAFRAAMDDFEKTLAEATDNSEVVRETERFKERVESETIQLRKALRSTKISTVLGSLQAFIKPNSPTLIGSAAVLAGKATSLAAVPILWVIAGAATAGLIEVGMHWFGKVQERREALKDTPFAYLFLARRKLIRL